jgi:urea-proton symporter
MGYIYLMMGCIISSAVIPATLTLTWGGQNWIAAAGSPVLGLACALIAWLVTAQKQCGGLTVECTGSNYPMLAGNVTALLSPIIFIPVLTFAFGQQNYNWHSMAAINQGDDSDIAARLNIDVESIRGQSVTTEMILDEAEQKHLKKSAIIARSMTVFMTIAFLVLWPMPLYGTGYIFSKGFFTGMPSHLPFYLFSTVPAPSFPNTTSKTDTCHRLGRSRHHVAILQLLLRGSLPLVARPQDGRTHHQVDVPGLDWQEAPVDAAGRGAEPAAGKGRGQ